MNCSRLRSQAFVYLDAELPDEERAPLEDHLSHCPDCQRLLNLERIFRARYLEPLRPDTAPESVRAQVLRLLAGLPAVDPTRAGWRPWVPASRLAGVALALVLMVTGVAIGLVLGRLGGAENADLHAAALHQLAEVSVQQHLKLVRGRLPYDITAGEPQAIEQWFDARLDFKVRFPRLAQRGLNFVGGRILHLEGSDVAALHYRLEGQDVSLFVLPLKVQHSRGLDEMPKFKVISRHGYDVIVWAAHGVTYSLVSEIGTRACMVCHQPGDRIDLSVSPHDSRKL